MDHHYEYNGRVFSLKSRRIEAGLEIEYKNSKFIVNYRRLGSGMLIITILGHSAKVIVEGERDIKHIFYNGDVFQLKRVGAPRRGVKDEMSGDIRAPLTGKVVKLMVKEGDKVKEGEVLIVIEAMKMEHKLRSPFDGRVKEIRCWEGDKVQGGDLLLSVEEGD